MQRHTLIPSILIGGAIALTAAAAQSAKKGWHLNGRKGVMHLVVIDKAHAKNRDTYRLAIGQLCAGEPICQVIFWIEGAKAPKTLPMSEAQVASKAAHWQYNANTGLRRFLWSCELFPNTPKDECL